MKGGERPSRPGLIWEKLGAARKKSGSGLSLERIVDAAITIADNEGIQALSMRRIAAELGSGVMSLYRHIRRKDDLLDLLLDAAYGEVELPRHRDGWRTELRLVAVRTRQALKRHTWLGTLLQRRPPLGPNYLRYFEYCLECVADLDLDIRSMTRAVGTLQVFVLGFVAFELEELANDRRIKMSETERRRVVEPYLTSILSTGAFPELARFLEIESSAPDDRDFLFGVDSLLDGIQARLAAR